MNDTEIQSKIHKAIKDFSGYGPSLESAIGALFLGKAMGWEVLYLMHSQATIRKYEKILGLKYKDHMEPSTQLSRKSYGWGWAKKFNAFWDIVRGQEKRIDRTKLEQEPVAEEQLNEKGNKQ